MKILVPRQRECLSKVIIYAKNVFLVTVMNAEKRRAYLTGLSYLEKVNYKNLAVLAPHVIILFSGVNHNIFNWGDIARYHSYWQEARIV